MGENEKKTSFLQKKTTILRQTRCQSLRSQDVQSSGKKPTTEALRQLLTCNCITGCSLAVQFQSCGIGGRVRRKGYLRIKLLQQIQQKYRLQICTGGRHSLQPALLPWLRRSL